LQRSTAELGERLRVGLLAWQPFTEFKDRRALENVMRANRLA
jgi:hypothetical protein